MSLLLQVKDLQIRRGGDVILNIPRLDILRGETLAVMGPNGAGKSTLLLSLAGLLPAAGSRVSFEGQTYTRQNALALRRRLALVLQEPLLIDASVYDNVALGLRFRHTPRGEIRRRVNHWLDRLGIAHLAGRRAHQLSGGEAQRVSLARAFALRPDLLLLDEPFSALDSATRQALLSEVQALLQETGTTAVLVTHRLSEARALAHRIVWLEKGGLRAITSAEAESSGEH